MAAHKGFTSYVGASHDYPPDERLIIAVYLRARNDLFGRSKKWREDAELFFEADGIDVKRLRARVDSEVAP